MYTHLHKRILVDERRLLIMKFMFLLLSFFYTQAVSAQKTYLIPRSYTNFHEYKINQSLYRVMQTQCGDKLFYFDSENSCWEHITLTVCDTSGCTEEPIRIGDLDVEGKILTIHYHYNWIGFVQYIYLNPQGTPDWRMTANQEDWQRY